MSFASWFKKDPWHNFMVIAGVLLAVPGAVAVFLTTTERTTPASPSASSKPSPTAEDFYRNGVAYQQQGRHDLAIAEFKKVLTGFPEDTDEQRRSLAQYFVGQSSLQLSPPDCSSARRALAALSAHPSFFARLQDDYNKTDCRFRN